MSGPTVGEMRKGVVALEQEGYKQTDTAQVLGILQSVVS